MPEGAPEPEPAPAPPRPSPVPDADEVRIARPPMVDDLEVITPPAKPVKVVRRLPLGLIAGLTGAGILVAALGTGIVMRQPIVEMFPAAAPAFEVLGLDVDTLGLSIEAVTSRAAMQGGRPVLEITGVIHNRTKAEVVTPPIRVGLLGKDGQVVAGMVAKPLNAGVPGGARRYFAISFPNPPQGSHELEITFDASPSHAEPTSNALPAAEAAPVAIEAKPLPADSPDALTPHESH